ncbi:unnamed protein product [Brachionus calyciflorus]|uniref:Peptidase A2 domain-containing protein n=1 Tax=Brachionus calyciflorus TaxID=104777 RepID=A0A814PDW5_9BILA|nr:unnamed protein product [Brachionus calyciflorus]
MKPVTETNSNEFKSKNDRILSSAIFNKSLVNYLFDTGADRMIINYKLFQKIKQDDPSTKLVEHKGNKLKSCSSELKIYGQINLNNFQVKAKETLNNVTILVTNHKSKNDCLLGRDILNRVNIPLMNTRVIKSKVDEFSKLIKQQFDKKESDKINVSNKRLFTTNKANENSNEDLKNSCKQLVEKNVKTTEKKVRFENSMPDIDEIENVNQEILNQLKTISAKSVIDLTPSENKKFAFKIELLNENQEPIITKCRPLPYNLKDKVKKELDKQLVYSFVFYNNFTYNFAILIEKSDVSNIFLT